MIPGMKPNPCLVAAMTETARNEERDRLKYMQRADLVERLIDAEAKLREIDSSASSIVECGSVEINAVRYCYVIECLGSTDRVGLDSRGVSPHRVTVQREGAGEELFGLTFAAGIDVGSWAVRQIVRERLEAHRLAMR